MKTASTEREAIVAEGLASLDDWCAKRCEAIQERVSTMILREKASVDNLELRYLVGQSDAYHRMRSYIHGSRDHLKDQDHGRA